MKANTDIQSEVQESAERRLFSACILQYQPALSQLSKTGRICAGTQIGITMWSTVIERERVIIIRGIFMCPGIFENLILKKGESVDFILQRLPKQIDKTNECP